MLLIGISTRPATEESRYLEINQRPKNAQEAYDVFEAENSDFELAALLLIECDEIINEWKDGAWEIEEEWEEEESDG